MGLHSIIVTADVYADWLEADHYIPSDVLDQRENWISPVKLRCTRTTIVNYGRRQLKIRGDHFGFVEVRYNLEYAPQIFT